jgi:hypothetical protein
MPNAYSCLTAGEKNSYSKMGKLSLYEEEQFSLFLLELGQDTALCESVTRTKEAHCVCLI